MIRSKNTAARESMARTWRVLSAKGGASRREMAARSILELRREIEHRIQAHEEVQDLYNNAPCGYHSLDKNGTFVQINDTELRWLGYTRDEVVGKLRFPDLITPASRKTYGSTFPRLKRRGWMRDVEIEMVRKDGTVLPVLLSATAVKDAKGRFRYTRTTLYDITARKRAEEALRRSEAHQQATLDAIPDHMFRLSREGVCLDFKAARASDLYVSPERILGSRVADVLPPAIATQCLEYIHKTLDTGTIQVYEYELPLPQGMESFEARMAVSGRDEVLAIVRNVSERRRLERQVLEISEREQRQVGRAIHDGLSQQLSGLAYMINVLHDKLQSKSSREAIDLEKIAAVLHQAKVQARHLARLLNPVSLESNGLMSALRSLAANVSVMYEVTCHFSCETPVLIRDNVTATHLYRITQEAVSNAVKHGRATRIHISLTMGAEAVVLTVQSNGRRFPAELPAKRGMGLDIMHYRARAIGGTLDIRTGADGGTLMKCSLPARAGNGNPGNGAQ